MKVVWRLDTATVRDVYEEMRESRQVAYTTVMTMMKILEDKGYLKKSLVDRAHVYTPAQPRQQVLGGMVRDFLDRVFDGAPDALLLHLAKDSKLTARQKRLVKQMIEDPPDWLEEWGEQVGADLKDGLREGPGYIAFAKDNGTVYLTYKVMAPDPFVAPFHSFLLARTPKEQPEEPRAWRKDEYPD